MGPWQSRRLQRSERIRFGIPLNQVCKHDIIPQPLLAMIQKLNKDAPFRKNVFRAPGHEATVKKVIFLLQRGYVIDIEELSVYTLASVLKTFLRKIPGGIFGSENEDDLFGVMDLSDSEDRFKRINRIISSLPIATQRLLVLLLGTFRVVADTASWADTGMTSEALGVSVAPSIFRSCVSGKMATMEDVIRFKVATRLTKYLIDQFGHIQLFPSSCYEYYTRMTGRPKPGIRDWKRGIYTSVSVIPGPPLLPARSSASHELTKNLQAEIEQQSTHSSEISPASPNCSSDEATSSPTVGGGHGNLCSAQLKTVNRHAESTRELSYLPQVHERQTARLRSRLQWYSSPGSSPALFAFQKNAESSKYGTVPNLDISSRSQSS